MTNVDDTERLADFLAGRLSPEDAAALQQRLADDPSLAAQEKLARAVRAVEDGMDAGPGAFGWARLSREITAEQESAVKATWQMPVWQAAAAIVLAVGLWQAVLAPAFLTDGPGYTTASGDAEGIVRVAFVPMATEGEIRALLQELGAEIVSGPSALGLYDLRPAEGASMATLADALGNAGDIVESASLP